MGRRVQAPSIRPARLEDAAAITAIYNEGIEDRGATFETALREVRDIEDRIRGSGNFPLVVALGAEGGVIGWAGASSYRARPCYAGIGEFSIYIARSARGQRLGRPLLEALVDAARRAGYWKLVSRIFTFNEASRALCRSCGFREVGTYEKHGKLEGRWLDVVIVERLIQENL